MQKNCLNKNRVKGDNLALLGNPIEASDRKRGDEKVPQSRFHPK